MKKNAGFKATAVLLSFLLVLQISPITAWADELNSSASETVSSQLPSGEAEGGSASDFQEPAAFRASDGVDLQRQVFNSQHVEHRFRQADHLGVRRRRSRNTEIVWAIVSKFSCPNRSSAASG